MRSRVGFATGLGVGYYLGARAGRQRYDQINRWGARLRRSGTFEVATERARAVVEEGVEKARSLVDSRVGNRAGNGNGSGPEGVPGPEGYSSSR